MTSWETTQELRSCKVSLTDYCFELPDSRLGAGQAIQRTVQVGVVGHKLDHDVFSHGESLLDRYDYPGGYGRRFDDVAPGGRDQPDEVQKVFQENQRVANLRMQEEAAGAVTLSGTSTAGHLLPGRRFELQRHPDGDGEYVLKGVQHSADLESSYLSHDEKPFAYESRFEALPAELPYRPARTTPRPSIAGTQTAVVVGAAEGDIFVDKYGRVKVKFHWDRRPDSGPESSCWLRVGQFWAGERWGAFFWPRVGHEVIVGFEEGDPDRPIVVGSVYNARNMPPFALPENRVLGGIKSFSASGNLLNPCNPLVNYNGILFDDGAGQEHVELHGERHITFSSEDTHLHNVDGPHRLNVATTRSVHVGRLKKPGSGSGGGGFSEDTPNKAVPGLSFSQVNGISQQYVLGSANKLILGDKMDVIVNPVGFITDVLGASLSPVAAAFTGLFAGPFMGQVGLVAGTKTDLTYGGKVHVHRGVRAAVADSRNIKDPANAVIYSLAALFATMTTAGMVVGGLESYDWEQTKWKALGSTILGLGGLLALVENVYICKTQLDKAKKTHDANEIAESSKTIAANANILVSLHQNIDTITNHAEYLGGNKAHYCDNLIQGAKEAILMYAGDTQNKQSVLAMDNEQIKVQVGNATLGPQMILKQTNPANITTASILQRLGFGANARSLKMDTNGITLAVGSTATSPKLIITANSITLSYNLSSLVIDGNGITLKTSNSFCKIQTAAINLHVQNYDLDCAVKTDAAKANTYID